MKLLPESDQYFLVAAATGLSLTLGCLIAFDISFSSQRPTPPLWQIFGAGLALGLFLAPFLLMGVYRMAGMTSTWEALAILSASMFWAISLRRQGELGVHPILMLAGLVIFVGAAFFAVRLIVRRNR